LFCRILKSVAPLAIAIFFATGYMREIMLAEGLAKLGLSLLIPLNPRFLWSHASGSRTLGVGGR
jgi:hypothetical protein